MRHHSNKYREVNDHARAMKYTFLTFMPAFLAHQYHWLFLLLLVGLFFAIRHDNREDKRIKELNGE